MDFLFQEIIAEIGQWAVETVNALHENFHGGMTAIRDLENLHHERILDLSIILLERASKCEVVTESPFGVELATVRTFIFTLL